MKITFEGKTIGEVLDQMQDMLAGFNATLKKEPRSATPPSIPDDAVFANPQGPGPTTGMLSALSALAAQGPGPKGPKEVTHVDKPVNKPLEKPGRTEKQKANDERLRERALAKKAAGIKPFDKMPKPAAVVKEPEASPVDPVEVVNIRNKTITDLQEAYANGHQQEVFELLSRFGNGAKSFRELPPEAFLPISQAIAKGALT